MIVSPRATAMMRPRSAQADRGPFWDLPEGWMNQPVIMRLSRYRVVVRRAARFRRARARFNRSDIMTNFLRVFGSIGGR